MARDIIQGYCKDSKCAHDVYTKHFVDEKIIPFLDGGTGTITDVLVDGKSVVNDGVAYIDLSDIKDIPTKVSELENDSKFVNEDYVNRVIGDIETLLGGI